jgi:hypothetical protein
MTAVARKISRRRAAPAVESSIYDSPTLLGAITPRAGAFVALLASGKSVGQFTSERLAMKAITSAARLERPNNFGATQHD